MKNSVLILLILLLGCTLESELKYSVPSEPWDESLGNHRAVIEVDKEADAVSLQLLWRRHDRRPDQKRFVIIHADSGDTIQNIYRLKVENESCQLVFGPVKKAGTYHFYYAPYEVQKDYGFYNRHYLKPENKPDAEWVLRFENKVDALPGTKVLEIQSRTAFDSFYPMELVPTKDEKNQFLAGMDSAYLLFPEGREHPIRMRDEIPLKWIKRGMINKFEADIFKNEYFAFQLGVYASKSALKNIQLNFSDLKSGKDKIPANRFTCFNLEGIDPYGVPFQKQVDIDSGYVQPLWIGVDIPQNIAPGKYTGTVELSADNVPSQSVHCEFQIKNKTLSDRGDGEPWRHSRLRWLNSTLGIDQQPTKAYQAIQVLGQQTYNFSGKKIKMGPGGMPESINIYGKDILESSIRFVIEKNDGSLVPMKTENIKLLENAPGLMSGYWENFNEEIEMTGVGVVESDGYLNFKINLKAKKDTQLKDVRLEIPFKTELAELMMGMGLPGAITPQLHEAKWHGPHDSFWLGNSKGGLWCELRGSDYHGPLLNLYRPGFPESWYNQNRGGFKIKRNEHQTLASIYSGKRSLKKNEEIEFEWSFLMTPVKKLETESQFINRYYHNGGAPTPSGEDLASGIKIVNLHHANEFNPHINYPFVAIDKMKSFVDDMHAKGQKVKIYYTIRELTNYTTEIWALRSLGTEILGYGRGYGYPWLQEHFINGYRPQWYQWFPDKSADASIVNSPGDSRWLNYYIEGLAWLVRNVDIDGLYLDDVSFDRRTVKRIRKVLDNEKPGCLIDLHSNTGFSKGPATQYMEFFPYMDKIWFGESFDYNNMSPENWLVEVSGIPFGLMGDMLQGGGNRWLGMLFGMTTRLPWSSEKIKADPRPVWKIWDEFKIHETQMMGFWEKDVPVTTTNPNVKATVYMKEGEALLSLGNFSEQTEEFQLNINWEKLSIDPEHVSLKAPVIQDFQQEQQFNTGDKIQVNAKEGMLIVVGKNLIDKSN